MKNLKVLFIGGTGVISSACSKLAVSKGIDLYHLNRGKSIEIRRIDGVKTILADIRNVEESRKALEGHHFDAVVDWIAFTPEHIENDISLFREITQQYVFISSASVYQKPPAKLPVTEETTLENLYWEYSRIKISCEQKLREEYIKSNFPFTIVRPSHTYDKTLLPIVGGFTTLQRMKHGLPIVVHGDGTSIWPLTHHEDFAVGLIGLLGKTEAINEAYHITTDELITWNTIYEETANALGVKVKMVHIPSEIIAKYNAEMLGGLLGDKANSMVFDNSKIKKLVPEFDPKIPFKEGVKEMVQWYVENEKMYKIDKRLNELTEKMIRDFSHFYD